MKKILLTKWLAGIVARRIERGTGSIRTSMTPEQLLNFQKAIEARLTRDAILPLIRRN
jgi:hypothetical protein